MFNARRCVAEQVTDVLLLLVSLLRGYLARPARSPSRHIFVTAIGSPHGTQPESITGPTRSWDLSRRRTAGTSSGRVGTPGRPTARYSRLPSRFPPTVPLRGALAAAYLTLFVYLFSLSLSLFFFRASRSRVHAATLLYVGPVLTGLSRMSRTALLLTIALH